MTNSVFADDYRLPGDPDDTLSATNPSSTGNRV